ncbi:MAG: glycine betaine ABC transporter substrate-binding protein [bacterium]
MRKSLMTIEGTVTIALLCMMILICSLPPKATSCVGRILSLGIANTEDQKVMAEMMSVLISESTGTKVNVVSFKTLDECREAIRKGELDLYVDYVCSGLLDVLNGEKVQIADFHKAYSTVKHMSDKRFSLIWLKPFGYENASILKAAPEWLSGIPNQAVCVARREVLNRFPILPRLINKLGNKIPNETIADLQQKQELTVSVKAFLEDRKMIRWAIQ